MYKEKNILRIYSGDVILDAEKTLTSARRRLAKMVRKNWLNVLGLCMFSLLLQTNTNAQPIEPGDTVTYQNGEDGYAGGVDVSIYSSNFYENAVGPGRLRIQRSSGDEHVNTLIRFNDLDIPIELELEQAYVTLRFQLENPKEWSRAIVDVYAINRNWSDIATWDSAENGESDPNWVLPGVQDVIERGTWISSLDLGQRYLINGTNYQNYDDEQAFDFELDPVLVQSWLDDPASNYGILLVMQSGTNSDVLFSSNEDETLDLSGFSMKPMLTVVTGCPGMNPMDLDGDGFVNYLDFQMLSVDWGSTYNVNDLTAMANDWLFEFLPDINGEDGEPDGIINYLDFQLLSSSWLNCYGIDQLMVMSDAWLTCTNGYDMPDCDPGE